MDRIRDGMLPDVNTLVSKNYELISRKSRIPGKHMVIEIFDGQFAMHDYGCNDLLVKVRSSYENGEKTLNGSISYRDCKMMVSDLGCVHNIDARFECLLVRLYPLSCVILKSSVLVIANEDMKLDSFIKDLCAITSIYAKKLRDESPALTKRHSSESTGIIEALKTMYDTHTNYNFNLPFEICVLECCIITSISHLESGRRRSRAELIEFESKYKILENKVYTNKKFKDISVLLHELKNPVSNINAISDGFEELINQILEDDDNLKVLEFSNHILHYGTDAMKNNLALRPVNHEVQFLIEYFDQEIDQLRKRTRTLDSSLGYLEKYISLELSITRNEMMRIEVMCSILGVSFGIGACLTGRQGHTSGLYGMNVINGFESNRYAFYVIMFLFLVGVFAAVYATRILQVRHRV